MRSSKLNRGRSKQLQGRGDSEVRRDFPEQFEELATVQEAIGPGANFFRDYKSGERFSLRDLDPAAGRHNEVLPDCGLMCYAAELEYAA